MTPPSVDAEWGLTGVECGGFSGAVGAGGVGSVRVEMSGVSE